MGPNVKMQQLLPFTNLHFESLGNEAVLSTQYVKGKKVDEMNIEKKTGKDVVTITVIKKIPSKNMRIKLVLSANYPYEKWLLPGIFITKIIS